MQFFCWKNKQFQLLYPPFFSSNVENPSILLMVICQERCWFSSQLCEFATRVVVTHHGPSFGGSSAGSPKMPVLRPTKNGGAFCTEKRKATLRILGMSGLGCQVATCFDALKSGCHERRVWCFHRRGQESNCKAIWKGARFNETYGPIWWVFQAADQKLYPPVVHQNPLSKNMICLFQALFSAFIFPAFYWIDVLKVSSYAQLDKIEVPLFLLAIPTSRVFSVRASVGTWR